MDHYSDHEQEPPQKGSIYNNKYMGYFIDYVVPIAAVVPVTIFVVWVVMAAPRIDISKEI